MARYKPVDRSARLLPVVLSEQILPGSFEFALDHLIRINDEMVENVRVLGRLDPGKNRHKVGFESCG